MMERTDIHVAASCGPHSGRGRSRSAAPSPAAFERAAALFRAVGDLARLRLVDELDRGERCVSELAEASATKLSTLSQQLRVLHAERVVKRRRDGKHIYYSLADEHVSELIRAALDHASEPAPTASAPDGKRRRKS